MSLETKLTTLTKLANLTKLFHEAMDNFLNDKTLNNFLQNQKFPC